MDLPVTRAQAAEFLWRLVGPKNFRIGLVALSFAGWPHLKWFRFRSSYQFHVGGNSPYLVRAYAGPFFAGVLRRNWDTPIVLPRQARRALKRGKSVHFGGYEHRRRQA